jgi:hypothetical protein
MKSVETQLAEKESELRELRKTTIRLELKESGLPPFAQTRLMKRFESESPNTGDVKKAIAEEQEYLRAVGWKRPRGSSGGTAEVSESDEQKNRLVECYKAMGLSEREAQLAAGVEDAVAAIQESEKGLYSAAKSMGMSDSEAKIFTELNRSSSW